MICKGIKAAVVSGAACVAVMSMSAEAETGFGKQAGKAGRWTVYVDKDAMTDNVECTALFDDRAQVQLTDTSLAISLRGRGGVQGYRTRLDDGPASELKLPSEVEKDVGAIFLDGATYQTIRAARRLRLEALTVLGSLVQEDIDLSANSEINRFFRANGCHI